MERENVEGFMRLVCVRKIGTNSVPQSFGAVERVLLFLSLHGCFMDCCSLLAKAG